MYLIGNTVVEELPFRIKDEEGNSYTGENVRLNMKKLNIKKIPDKPKFNPKSHSASFNKNTNTWKVSPLTGAAKKKVEDAFWAKVDKEIEERLTETDWTQITVDYGKTYGRKGQKTISPEKYKEFEEYREELLALKTKYKNKIHLFEWPRLPTFDS